MRLPRSRSRFLAALLALLALGPAAAQSPPGDADKIVNGVLESGLPAVAAIRDSVGTLCTATLVGCRTLLSAASCFCYDPATGQELEGAACAARSDLLDPSRFTAFFQHAGSFPLASIQVHPGFVRTPGTEARNLAILKLAGSVAGLAPSRINRSGRLASDAAGTVAGFGRGGGGADDFGLKRSGAVATGTCEPAGVPTASNICWSYAQPVGAAGTDSSTCDGDAGAPLYSTLPSGTVVAGVASGWSNANCLTPSNAWTSDVFVERSWIEATAGGDLDLAACGSLPAAGETGGAIAATSGQLNAATPQRAFSFQVPANSALLRATLNGDEFGATGDPNFDLYLRAGQPPTTSTYDCASRGAGLFEVCEVQLPAAGTWHALVQRVARDSTYQLTATSFAKAVTACAPDATTLCLDDQPGDRRFQVRMTYFSPPRGLSGNGQAIALGSLGVRRGGLFHFFGADNPEVLVKILNGCGFNNRFWVYLTAGTDLGYAVTVTDTMTGVPKNYTNTDGTPAPPLQDINAFACN